MVAAARNRLHSSSSLSSHSHHPLPSSASASATATATATATRPSLCSTESASQVNTRGHTYNNNNNSNSNNHMSSLTVWSKFATMSRDSLHLARALAQGVLRKPKTPARPILLEHARNSNSAAVSLLKVDKQIGLMQYHGLSGYLRQSLPPRFQSSLSTLTESTTSEVAAESNNNNNNNNKGAKVAFMVTAAMRTELTDRLGYDTDQIKQLTPLQVSLILHHNVTPATMEQELPNLMQAHQEEMEQEQVRQEQEQEEEQEEQMRQQQEQQQMQQPQLVNAELTTEPNIRPQDSYDSSRDVIPFSAGYMSVNLLGGPDNKNCLTSGFADNWFEVTETKDGVVSRVGLYVDQNEAGLGCSTRQWIADRNGQLLTFKVNKVSAESLL